MSFFLTANAAPRCGHADSDGLGNTKSKGQRSVSDLRSAVHKVVSSASLVCSLPRPNRSGFL